jgi:mRNA interferase RelE/StbE
MYKLVIHKQAAKKLQSLSHKERLRITDKILELSYDPDHLNLDVKKLVGTCFWRLRVGAWRILYCREDILGIIKIERIGSRGDIYK